MRRSFVVAAAVLCLLGWFGWLRTDSPGAAASGRGEAPPPVPLGAGFIGHDQWNARLELPEDAHEREAGAVCLTVGLLIETSRGLGEGSEGTECSLPPEKNPTIEAVGGRARGKQRVAVAMLFPAEARRMFLRIRGKPGETVRLKRLPVRENEPVNQIPLASFARGYAQRFCIERLIVYGASNERIGGLGRQPCA